MAEREGTMKRKNMVFLIIVLAACIFMTNMSEGSSVSAPSRDIISDAASEPADELKDEPEDEWEDEWVDEEESVDFSFEHTFKIQSKWDH